MSKDDHHTQGQQRSWTTAGCFVIAAMAGGVSGCGEHSPGRDGSPPANVVLIVIDTLRADHLGCYGYFRDTSPNIDAFAEQAIFFEQAFAPMATTMPAHTSLFTGLHPLEHGILANAIHGGKAFGSRPEIKSFVQLAKDNGYATGGFVSAAPLKSACGLNVGFDTYDEPREKLRSARRTTDRALTWLAGHTDQRFLLFVHYFDPHFPYRPPPSYRDMFRTDPELERYLAEREVTSVIEPSLCRGTTKTVARRVTNLYDAEIRFCDEQVGRLLDWLRERGLWDNSVIVLTADHGEGLNQHAWPQHGRTWNEQVQIPLMIRFPGPRDNLPKRFAPLVSLIDVFPTVLGQLKPPWAETFLQQATGVDVLAPDFLPQPVLAQRSGRHCADEGGPLYALTSDRWRYHYFPEGEELLFDRLTDPHELRDIAAVSPAQADQMRRQVQELVAQLEQRAASFGPDTSGPLQLDPELQRQMEALGYVASASDEETDPNNGEQTPTDPTDQPNSP